MRPVVRCSALALVAAVAGCDAKPPLVTKCTGQSHMSRTGPALVGLEYGTQATPIPLDSVQFSDWAAEKAVVVQHLTAARTATNTVEVTARLISCADEPIALRVRTSFLDAAQAPTEAASAWQTVFVQPHLTATYSERSISTQVSHYLLEITPP